jgi:serine/threonine protein kinase
MDPERWQQIERVYLSTLERPPGHRAAFLKEACQDDSELRREVESLLAQPEASLRLSESGWETATIPMEPRAAHLAPNSMLGPYRIDAVLGSGGMGEVYRAVDTRLERKAAIKIAREKFSARFEREARTISTLNHPNICMLFDIGPNYMVTELVEGETLRAWLKRPQTEARSVEIAEQILEALRAAHNAGIVHRDLKPENIMIRWDGYLKVLDFGLAKRTPGMALLQTESTLTADLSQPGEIVGTIAYMSPEQILGREADARSDLFAFGIVFYEMLTGTYPWPRQSGIDRMHAILHDDPPPTESLWSGILAKLLCKNREERYASAEAVLEALASPPAPRPRATTRLIVLPFRILRSHEASDFLAVSLPDAIASSLAAVDSLLVRSTILASRFASSGEIDVKAIAEQAQVDAVLTGSLLSDGERLRVAAQLVQAPGGTLLWSTSSQVSLGSIFQLQDDLVDRIVKALAPNLTPREQGALSRDVPANAPAYELYLRANQLVATGHDAERLMLARDLYLRSVEADPKYAPAWACLGRIHRMIGKFAYGLEELPKHLFRAEDAFQKAFALHPDLPVAHNYYTYLQTDTGRPLDAMVRLLPRAREHRHDPNLYAGLVHACRYCGLLDASIAAHVRARQLDPNIRTTVLYSYMGLSDFQGVLDHCSGPGDGYGEVWPSNKWAARKRRLRCLSNLRRRFGRNRCWPMRRPCDSSWKATEKKAWRRRTNGFLDATRKRTSLSPLI